MSKVTNYKHESARQTSVSFRVSSCLREQFLLIRKCVPFNLLTWPFDSAMMVLSYSFSTILLLSLGAPHKAMNNSKIDGKDIPKGTQLFINHWAFHYDEREWKEPTAFKPERFLDSNGSFVHGMNISFLPFGAGRRVCVGEAMAKLELFLFISNILYRYDLKIEPGKAAPDLEGVLGVVLGPKPYEIQFIKRPGVKDIDI